LEPLRPAGPAECRPHPDRRSRGRRRGRGRRRRGGLFLRGSPRGRRPLFRAGPAQRTPGIRGELRRLGRAGHRRRCADHPRRPAASRQRSRTHHRAFEDQHGGRDDQRERRLQRSGGMDPAQHRRARRWMGRGLRRVVRNRRRHAMSRVCLVFLLGLLLPMGAAADYLYGLNKESGFEPYVIVLADVSGSMATKDAGCPAGCTYTTSKPPRCKFGSKTQDQYTRMHALKSTLETLIPQTDNVVVGRGKFGVTERWEERRCYWRGCRNDTVTNYCKIVRTNPLPTKSNQSPPTANQLV